MTAFHSDSYMDIIPENKDPSEYSATSAKGFETLAEVINRTNAMIRSGGLSGQIITIESISFDANNDWKIDTEVSLSSFSTKTVFILRIFYELGEPSYETIGEFLSLSLKSHNICIKHKYRLILNL